MTISDDSNFSPKEPSLKDEIAKLNSIEFYDKPVEKNLKPKIKNNNLDLSFEFYSRASDHLLDKFNLHLEESDLNILKRSVKRYLLNNYYSKLVRAKNYYSIPVSIDIETLISTYDYLDILVSYDPKNTRLDLNQLITVNNLTTYPMKKLLMLYIDHLSLIINKKVDEEYRAKYGLDLSCYAEDQPNYTKPDSRYKAYPALFDTDDENHSLAIFLELENNLDNSYDSARFYLTAFYQKLETIYLKYGSKIENSLNLLLNQTMANRWKEVNSVHKHIEESYKSKYQAGFIFGIFDIVQSFIIDRNEFYPNYKKSFAYSVIKDFIDEAKKNYGLEIEQELKDLFSYELFLENLAIEMYGLYMLAEKGTLANLESFSYQSTVELLNPSFKINADSE